MNSLLFLQVSEATSNNGISGVLKRFGQKAVERGESGENKRKRLAGELGALLKKKKQEKDQFFGARRGVCMLPPQLDILHCARVRKQKQVCAIN